MGITDGSLPENSCFKSCSHIIYHILQTGQTYLSLSDYRWMGWKRIICLSPFFCSVFSQRIDLSDHGYCSFVPFLFAGVFFMQNGFSMHGTPIPTSLFKFRGLWLEKNYSFISENSYVNCMLLIHSSPPSSAKSDLKWAPLLSFLVSADLAMAFPARSMFLSSSFLTRPL